MLFHQSLETPQRKTKITLGVDALVAAAPALAQWSKGRTLFVLTSARIRGLHDVALTPALGSAAKVVFLEVEDGEAAKQVEVAEGLWRRMLEAGGKRDSRLLAFGGGSVGDLGGFVAGCFLRGIEFCQVPTTLLAQVDAAIGGKTGVDLPGGKNTVGLFHDPVFVVSDTRLLTTLPRGELRAGLAEVVKKAFLLDPALLGQVERSLEQLLEGQPEALAPVVAAACAAKCAVVEADHREGGLRRLLNFGHTLAHAIESHLGYEGLRHGDAVSYGMLFALRLAERHSLPKADADRLRRLLGRFGLPPLPPLDVEALLSLTARDKKATEKGLVWVLPAALGRGEMVEGLDHGLLHAELEAFLVAPFASP